MINEVINEILKAEAQAEEILSKAEEKAQDIIATAENQANSIIEQANENAKALRAQIKAESEDKASAEYQTVMEHAREESELLTKEKERSAIDAGEYLFGRIVNGNC